MCGLFGFMNYGNTTFKDIKKLADALGCAAAIRGTDATGISYNNKNKLQIDKAPKSAYQFKFDVPDTVKVMMGHTRHSTQGSEKKNYNNHPFKGKLADKSLFAFAHNGVLYNDVTLKNQLKLPHSKIETDSYVGVQILEQRGDLSMESLRFLGESVHGMFTFTILDAENNLYIVKNDSPLHILDIYSKGIIIYASTKEILWKALMETDFFEDLVAPFKDDAEDVGARLVSPKEGDLIKISPDGTMLFDKFEPADYYTSKGYYDRWNTGSSLSSYSSYNDYGNNYKSYTKYVNTLDSDEEYYKLIVKDAEDIGYDKESLDKLREFGYSLLEIEELVYSGTVAEEVEMVEKYYERKAAAINAEDKSEESSLALKEESLPFESDGEGDDVVSEDMAVVNAALSKDLV
jgi:predicted glutamine amidotransferase